MRECLGEMHDQHTRPLVLSRKEFVVIWEDVSSARDVVNRTSNTGYLGRLPLPSAIRTHLTVTGFLVSQVHVLCLRFRLDRLDRQSVVCVHTTVLDLKVLWCSWRCSWPFLEVPLYLSFCIHHLPKWHMMSVHVWTYQLSYPWSSTFFIWQEINNKFSSSPVEGVMSR